MGQLPVRLAGQLRDTLSLERAIETGTYKGDGLRALGGLFASATSIEMSAELADAARAATADLPTVLVVHGDSRDELPRLIDPSRPTLYWLDGHWSGGRTAGRADECPLLNELAATAAGHADDCVLIDDARLFLASPPPPHDALLWPTFMQLYDMLHTARPDHYITVLHDIVIAVPGSAKPAVDAFAREKASSTMLASGRRALGRALRPRTS